jgi:hypothetical protein
MALCDLVHHDARSQALRNDLRFDLIRPVPVNLTSDFLVVRTSNVVYMEKLPLLVHRKPITD